MSRTWSLDRRGRENGVVVIELHGRIELEAGSGELKAAILECVKDGKHDILVRMANVSYIDLHAVAEMASVQGVIVGCGGSMKLVDVRNKHRGDLGILFEIFDSENEAAASFQQGNRASA